MSINTLEELFQSNIEWLLGAITTKEASALSGVPETTLVTMRSRGGGPRFFVPENTRLVRYFRVDIYLWLLSGGLKTSTSDPGTPISFFATIFGPEHRAHPPLEEGE